MQKGLFLTLCLLGFATAQAQYTDTGGWLGFGVDQKLDKDWSWSMKWENRWSMGGTWHDRGFVNTGIGYKLNKNWSLGVQLRWIERQRSKGFYASGRRIAVRLNGEAKGGPGEWKWRLMSTKAWGPHALSEEMDISDDLVQRVRLGYAWQVRDGWTLVPSYEVFSKNLNQRSMDLSSRLQLQLRHKINKRLNASLAYLWSDEWQTDDPWREHVIRFNLNWKLPDWKGNDRKRSVPAARTYATDGNRRSKGRQSVSQCKSSQVFVSEVHAKGDPADFIELSNASTEPCSLKGWSLTDDLEKAGLVFGSTVLPPEGCWLGYQNGKDSFSFGVSTDFEIIYFKNSAGGVQVLELLISNPKQSVSLDINGNKWITPPSPGRPNPKDSEE